MDDDRRGRRKAIEQALAQQPVTYPMAPRDQWYGEGTFENAGGRMTSMHPDEFLAASRPLTIDDISRENIDLLKDHMQSGGTLDPLALYRGGKEDGRHRAIAARELGMTSVPVINYRDVPRNRAREGAGGQAETDE